MLYFILLSFRRTTMKKRFISLFIFSATWLAGCALHKKTVYNIPADITGEKRKALLAALDKGGTLYRLHCAACHGISTKGKKEVPNFSNQQIDNYTAWAIRRDPRNHAVAANMSPEQLHEVFMYLKARTPQNPTGL